MPESGLDPKRRDTKDGIAQQPVSLFSPAVNLAWPRDSRGSDDTRDVCDRGPVANLLSAVPMARTLVSEDPRIVGDSAPVANLSTVLMATMWFRSSASRTVCSSGRQHVSSADDDNLVAMTRLSCRTQLLSSA